MPQDFGTDLWLPTCLHRTCDHGSCNYTDLKQVWFPHIPTIFQWYYCKCKCSKMSLKVALKERANHDINPAVPNISQYQGILKTWGHKCRRWSPKPRSSPWVSCLSLSSSAHLIPAPHTKSIKKQCNGSHKMAPKMPEVEGYENIWKHEMVE